ncbi:related to nuclear division protein Rft1 [Melanopsichium pennsylvanicum]|uniref:Man(5)GlcNAc(2)-PP-dolichol translocation protein RFT1 n=2 Tax=Melanopsichium pennsylvanicum TaxID=63383 RepID=A0AAJ4XGI3_9BASI|nr:related to nuclear division protein Rft1 [Melanopsichium pennsylvanicum 4]SNX82089.1 related to nuclear division protein Rft1 [Melanopsichium pennsylvanicum]
MAEATKAGSASASSLILLQVSARTLTFILNQLLVRLVSPSIFGIANIQLELLLSTILFLSRDGFRTILIRNEASVSQHGTRITTFTPSGPRKGTTNSIHNISLFPIPIGFILTAVACTTYFLYISPSSMHAVPTFHASILLYALGALTELLYEPLLIRAVRLGQPALRVKAEGAAVFVKVLSTIATIVLLPKWSLAPAFVGSAVDDERATALLAFGIGQAGFGLTMLAVHLAHFFGIYGISDTLDLYVPRSETVAQDGKQKVIWVDKKTISLCATMAQQGLLKHGLTEADKFAVARFANLEDQGGYALASNYGSLVARILFQPVEETARIVFSSELAAIDQNYASSPVKIPVATFERVVNMLSALFKLHILLGLLLTTFGGPLSTPLLYIMAGPQWALNTSAPAILAAYTFYLPIMGINGIVEGFVQSVASEAQIKKYSRVLVGASVGFVGVLAGINTVVDKEKSILAKTGLVWANALSLCVRAWWCWRFLITYFEVAARGGQSKDFGAGIVSRIRPGTALPTKPTLVMFALIATTLRVAVPRLMPSNAQLLLSATALGARRMQAIRSLLPTLALAAGCAALVLGSLVVFERRSLSIAQRSLGRGHHSTTDAKKSH